MELYCRHKLFDEELLINLPKGFKTAISEVVSKNTPDFESSAVVRVNDNNDLVVIEKLKVDEESIENTMWMIQKTIEKSYEACTFLGMQKYASKNAYYMDLNVVFYGVPKSVRVAVVENDESTKRFSFIFFCDQARKEIFDKQTSNVLSSYVIK